MCEYGIAYLDIDGEGFSDTEPFIVDCSSFQQCKEDMEWMMKNGYRKVIPFRYNGSMDYYTWDYVYKNKISFE